MKTIIEGRMKVTYHLPAGVKSFKYEPNTHFVELTDKAGNTLHMPAHGVMEHRCKACEHIWWSGSNQAAFCPLCACTDLIRAWGTIQVAFLPERESAFVAPTPSLLPSAGSSALRAPLTPAEDDKKPVPISTDET